MTTLKICILGGGGFVGNTLAAQLTRAGHNLLIPGRHRFNLRHLDVLPGARSIEADIHNPAELKKLFTGMDAVINLVGILHGSTADFHQAHAELPEKVVAACRASGVKRLLHMSALGASVHSPSQYQQSKARGEAVVQAADDLQVTVFRPSVIFGPGDNFMNLFAKLMTFTPILPLADADALFQPVFVSDVARTFVESLENPATYGQSYNLCGPKTYTLQALVELTARTLGLKRWIIPLGETPSLIMATALEFMPGPTLMSRDNHYATLTDNICPDGFPFLFGVPATLESELGYLAQHNLRSILATYRRVASR